MGLPAAPGLGDRFRRKHTICDGGHSEPGPALLESSAPMEHTAGATASAAYTAPLSAQAESATTFYPAMAVLNPVGPLLSWKDET